MSNSPTQLSAGAHRTAGEHPAVQAWRRLGHKHTVPMLVHPIKDKRSNAVYRLEGIGANGASVIAKRAVPTKLQIERTIYEKLLPEVAIQAVDYYGYVEEADGDTAWIFVECAEGEQYDNSIFEHRRLAGRWLGLLHSHAALIPTPPGFPGRMANHYLTHLRLAWDRIEGNLGNPALNRDNRRLLLEILQTLELLESRWSDIETLCTNMPQTLIHGDFAPKNMLVDTRFDRLKLMVFDWGTAGWGSPAADLVQASDQSDSFWVSPELETYRTVVSAAWPHLDGDEVLAIAQVGKIFRTLTVLKGDTVPLSTKWVSKSLRKLPIYLTHLTEGIGALGLALPPLLEEQGKKRRYG